MGIVLLARCATEASAVKVAQVKSALAALLAALIGLPFAVLLLLSIARDWRYPALWPMAFHTSQWQALGVEWQSLAAATLRSAVIALAVGVCASAAGFFTSQRLEQCAHRARWSALAVLPFAVSPVVLALCLSQTFAWLGLGGHYLGVMLVQFPFAYAYAVLLTLGFWNRHTQEIGELAVALGANNRQVWWRVRLPLARGVLGICLFQTALMSWFDFVLARLIGGGRVDTLPLKVFDYFGAGDLRLAAAAGVVLVAPPACAVLLNPRLMSPAQSHRLPR